MILGHGTTSTSDKCIYCNKTTSTYASFYEGNIEIKVFVCNDEYDKIRKFKQLMQGNIRMIKAQLNLKDEF